MGFFDHLPPSLRLHFLWYKSWQKVDFFDHLPPPLVNVVCERPLKAKQKLGLISILYQQTGDVVDVAVGAGEFTILAKIVTDLGLVDTLKNAEALTIFAPNDKAFAKLPAGTLESLTPEQVSNYIACLVLTLVSFLLFF